MQQYFQPTKTSKRKHRSEDTSHDQRVLKCGIGTTTVPGFRRHLTLQHIITCHLHVIPSHVTSYQVTSHNMVYTCTITHKYRKSSDHDYLIHVISTSKNFQKKPSCIAEWHCYCIAHSENQRFFSIRRVPPRRSFFHGKHRAQNKRIASLNIISSSTSA